MKNELEKLQARRQELTSQADQAKADARKASDALAAGAGDVDLVITSKAKASALAEARSTVDSQIAQIEAKLAQEAAANERQAKLQAAADFRSGGKAQADEFLASLAEMDAALKAGATRALSALASLQRDQAACKDAQENLLGIDVYDSTVVQNESVNLQRRIALAAEITALAGDTKAIDAALGFMGTNDKSKYGLTFPKIIEDALYAQRKVNQ